MAARTPTPDFILEAALVGYQHKLQDIKRLISELRALLAPVGPQEKQKPEAEAVRRRRLSTKTRKRMAAAQKMRWAKHRKRQEKPASERRNKSKR